LGRTIQATNATRHSKGTAMRSLLFMRCPR
jgi:hypothetical protein